MRRVICWARPFSPVRLWTSASWKASERSTAAMSFCIAAVAVTYTVANRAPAEAMNSAA